MDGHKEKGKEEGDKEDRKGKWSGNRGENRVVLMERQIRSMPWRADSAWGLVRERELETVRQTKGMRKRLFLHGDTPICYLLWDTNMDKLFWHVFTLIQQSNFVSTQYTPIYIGKADNLPSSLFFSLILLFHSCCFLTCYDMLYIIFISH